MTFGINIDHFPISKEGSLKVGIHLKWIERRRLKEKFLENNAMPKVAVDMPSKFDVLLGRGILCQEHFGNKVLHELIAKYFDEYDSAERNEKSALSEMVMSVVRQSSGRFLKCSEDSGMWVEVTDKEAKEKVSHGFRRKREVDSKKVKGGQEGVVIECGGGKRMKG